MANYTHVARQIEPDAIFVEAFMSATCDNILPDLAAMLTSHSKWSNAKRRKSAAGVPRR